MFNKLKKYKIYYKRYYPSRYEDEVNETLMLQTDLQHCRMLLCKLKFNIPYNIKDDKMLTEQFEKYKTIKLEKYNDETLSLNKKYNELTKELKKLEILIEDRVNNKNIYNIINFIDE